MQSENRTDFAVNLSRLRRKRQWSQRELAERLHTDHTMVTRWEKGKVVPRLDTIGRIAAALEVSEDELMSGTASTVISVSSEDPELTPLLSKIHQLDRRDREALKTVLEAMLTRSQLKAMVGETARQPA